MQHTSLVENADCFRIDATQKLDPKMRSLLGQFMTPAPIARFMASMFDPISSDSVRLLDAGAGVGSLSAAFLESIASREQTPSSVESVAYELDPVLIDYLSSTLSDCCEFYRENGWNLSSVIKSQDFLEAGAVMLSKGLLAEKEEQKRFTHAILNPPYKKISANSPHRKWLRGIGIETSNLYTGFIVTAIKLLQPGGEIVAIVPRSFCNGPYFKPFRDFLLSETALKNIHVFESRTKAFKDDEVLQENIIFHAKKGTPQADVVITASGGGAFTLDDESGTLVVEDLTTRTVGIDSVVKRGDVEKFIHIASTELEQHVVDRISVYQHKLDKLNIKVSTGPVVDFRLRNDIKAMPEDGTVPLLYASHFTKSGVQWPKSGKKPNAIFPSTSATKWLMPNNGSYVVTKRFTSKEERRRVVAWVYDSSLPGALVGFENHLNVFHRNGALDCLQTRLVGWPCSSTAPYWTSISGNSMAILRSMRLT